MQRSPAVMSLPWAPWGSSVHRLPGLAASGWGGRAQGAAPSLPWTQLVSSRCWEVVDPLLHRSSDHSLMIPLSWSKCDRDELVMKDASPGLQLCLWNSRYHQQLAAGLTVHSKFPSNVQLSTAHHPLMFSLSTFQLKVENLGAIKRAVEITKPA